MTTEDKERKLRRIAQRQGLALGKSRRRDQRAFDFGGYMLIDGASNKVIAGVSPYPYCLNLHDVEIWLTEPSK